MNHRAATILASASIAMTACAIPGERGGKAETTTVTVDGATRHQTIDGFGTCLISWDDKMTAWYRRPESARVYGDELRFNILRCNLWGGGTIDAMDASQISHRDPNFAKTDPRTPVFLDFAKRVLTYQPNLKVVGTVWSPPAWMKENNSITDDKSGAIQGVDYVGEKDGAKVEFRNRVRRDRYPHFANWLVEMSRHYEANGVPIYALSAANEPQFTQSFESCVWTGRDLATITGLTGEALKRAGQDRIKMFGPETMTGFNWDGGPNHLYTRAMRENPSAWKHLGFWATHGYADGVKADVSSNSLAKFWSLVAQDKKPYWVTEGGTGGHSWPEPVGERGVGIAIHNALVAGNASAFVPWQYAEDSTSEHNLMPLAGPNKKTHVVRHYSRFIPAGAVRIDATPGYGAVNTSAFRHGKDVTVVLLNSGDRAQAVTVQLKNLAGLTSLNAVRTSASEDSKSLPEIKVKAGSVRVEVPGPGIVTLSTLK